MAKTTTVSFSELDCFRQCPFKHQLAYKERWQDPTPGTALVQGKLFHEILELYYTRLREGMLPAGIVQEIQSGDLLSDDLGRSTDIQDNVAWMFQGYVERYGSDREWEIVAVEDTIEDWLPMPGSGGRRRSSFRFKGKVDLLVKDVTMGGGLWVVDHKTSSRELKQKDLDFEDQMPLYIQHYRRKGLDVRGAIYNAVRSKKLVREMTPEERFKRIPMVRPDAELEEIEAEVYRTMRRAYQPQPDGGDPPRHPDAERCGWKCGFTEACLAGRKGGDTRQMLADMGFVQDFTRH